MSTPTDELTMTAYQEGTADTAIYPEVGRGTPTAVLYTALGLTNEAGELAGVVKKMLRDSTAQATVRSKVYKEGGDILWYAARFLAELFIQMSDVCGDLDVFADFQDATADPALSDGYPDATRRSATAVLYCTLKLAGSAGKAADAATVVLDGSASPTVMAAQVGEHMNAVMYWLARVADEVGLSLADIANGNRAKLLDRQERGVIGGSGDDR
jgi:hypothetical protein